MHDPRNSTITDDSSCRDSDASLSNLTKPSSNLRSGTCINSFDSEHLCHLRNNYRQETLKTPSSTGFTPVQLQEALEGAAESSGKPFRCSTGQHSKACSSTVKAFQRHEKQHVDQFCCVSKEADLEEEAVLGKRCIICKALNPDQAHFANHRLESCLARDLPLGFTRKDGLMKHLKDDHAISSNDAKAFARMQYRTINKTAFTCGICVGILFDSKETQLCHIEEVHSRGMQGWDGTTMMRNLLRHPVVNRAWREILASHPHVDQQFVS